MHEYFNRYRDTSVGWNDFAQWRSCIGEVLLPSKLPTIFLNLILLTFFSIFVKGLHQ